MSLNMNLKSQDARTRFESEPAAPRVGLAGNVTQNAINSADGIGPRGRGPKVVVCRNSRHPVCAALANNR